MAGSGGYGFGGFGGFSPQPFTPNPNLGFSGGNYQAPSDQGSGYGDNAYYDAGYGGYVDPTAGMGLDQYSEATSTLGYNFGDSYG
jgi:hypothetical protein